MFLLVNEQSVWRSRALAVLDDALGLIQDAKGIAGHTNHLGNAMSSDRTVPLSLLMVEDKVNHLFYDFQQTFPLEAVIRIGFLVLCCHYEYY